MKAFKFVANKKLLAAIGFGASAALVGLNEFYSWRRKAYCDYAFDPHVPTNLPSGHPKWDYDWDK